jgi:isoleucyl-tRNA synthetase
LTAEPEADNSQGLASDYRPLDLEKEIREFWEKNQIRGKLELLEKDAKGVLGYVEGPPTLNGIPHIGHARGRVMKDIRYRWKTMQGYYVPFWAGWDCQGLPVELEVEKLLGVKNKRELLERVGEERFIEECKKVIMKYHREWVESDRRLGIFINQDKAYWTYRDEYIEREWQYLKRAWDQNLLEEGHYVVAYCPGCQTSLSSAEVGYEGSYKEVEDPSLYFKFKVTGSQNEFFLVWTTMPFTIITDTMLAVKPDAEYVKVRVGNETWIMVRQRVEPVMQELGITKYQITEAVTGKSLEGTRYDYPLKDLIPKQAELEKQNPLVHTVIGEDFVEVDTATGVVHLSPGNGEEDFWAAQRRKVPVFAPFDDERRGRFQRRLRQRRRLPRRRGAAQPQRLRGSQEDEARVPDLLALAPQAGVAGAQRVLPPNRQDKQQSPRSRRESHVLLRRAQKPLHIIPQRRQTMVHLPRTRLGHAAAHVDLREMRRETTGSKQKGACRIRVGTSA